MRSRRTFLVGSAVAVSGVLSGCAGVLEEEDGDGGDDGVEDPTPDVDPAERGDSGEGQVTEGDDTNDRAQRQEIFDLYASGVETHNDAITTRNRAVSAFNNDRFDTAISRFETAESNWREAEDDFSEAAGIALQIGHSDAREICDTAEQYVTHLRLSCEDNIDAARAERDDRPAEVVNDNIDEAEAHIADAEQLNIRDPDVLRGVLDLD